MFYLEFCVFSLELLLVFPEVFDFAFYFRDFPLGGFALLLRKVQLTPQHLFFLHQLVQLRFYYFRVFVILKKLNLKSKIGPETEMLDKT